MGNGKTSEEFVRSCLAGGSVTFAWIWAINAKPLEKLIIWGRAVTSDAAHFAKLYKLALLCDLWVKTVYNNSKTV